MNIGCADLVIISSAIRKDNPELLEAKKEKNTDCAPG